MADIALRLAGAAAGALLGPALPLGLAVSATSGAFIGFGAGGTLAGFLFPPKRPPIYISPGGGQQIMLATYGTPLGIVYGTARKQIQVVWGQPIQTHTETTTQNTSKGGGQEQQVITEWKSATFFGVACEGPALGVRKAWFNSDLVYNLGANSRPDWFLASRDMHIMLGEDDQQPSSIMESFEGAGNVPAYRNVVGVLLDTLALGPSGQRIPNVELEIARSGSLVTLVPQEWITLPESEAFYDSGLGDTWRVVGAVPDSSRVWMILDSGGNPRRLALFNAFSQTYDVTLDFDGDIYLQGVNADGSVWVAQEGGTAEGLHRVNTTGGDDYTPGSDSFERYSEMAETGSDGAIVLHINSAIGGHPIYEVTVDGAVAKTQITVGGHLNALFARAAAYPGRVYIHGIDVNNVTPGPGTIGYVDSDGIWHLLHTYNRNSVTPYGIVGASYIYVRSGNTGESNVIEKRSLDGALVDSVTLSSASSTGYSDVYALSLSSDEAYLFVQQDDAIWKIATGTMTEDLANATAAGTDEQFVQGSAYQGKGVMVTAIGTDDTVMKIVPPDQLLDESATTVADVVEDLITRSILTSSDLNLTALEDVELLGYVLDRPMPIAEAINILRPLFFFDLIESDYKIKAVLRTGSSLATIPEAHLGARTSRDEIVDPVRITRIQEIDLPQELTLNYISRNKDYQTGTQSAKRLSTTSQQKAVVSAPVVFDDDTAAQIVTKGLVEAWSQRETMEIQTSRRYSLYEPGDIWTLPDGSQVRHLDKLEGANGLIKWRGVRHFADGYEQDQAEGVSSGGGQAIVPLSPTEAFPLDIHLLRSVDDYPGEYWAARGLSTRWDGTKLYRSPDGGVSYEAIPNGLIAAAAGIGALTEALDGPPMGRYETFDWANVVTARMRPGVEPASYTEAQIFAGTAIPLLIKAADEPGEILYYRNATNTSGQIWEFTGLLRARGGTEEFVEHSAGELVVLLDAALLSVQNALGDIGREIFYKAPSIGSVLTNASPIAFTNTNKRAKPLAPIHLGGGINGSDDIVIHWTRRTRYPTSLSESGEVAPLGEAYERYVVEVYDGDDVIRTAGEDGSIVTGEWTYTAAMQTEDFGETRPHVYVVIYQLSDTYGRGYPCEGWVPAVPAGSYEFYRIDNITNTNGTRIISGEIQLIDIDGATVVSSGLVPDTNFPGGVHDSAPNHTVPTGLTDADLTVGYRVDATVTSLYLEFRLPYPAVLAGMKQAGTPTFISGGAIGAGAGGAVVNGLGTWDLSGANRSDPDDLTLLESFSVTYPGDETLSALYPIT